MNALRHHQDESRPALDRDDLLRDRAFIGSQWVDSDLRIPVHNPATGKVLGHVADVGAKGAREAIGEAAAALPSWRSLAAKERAVLLRAWLVLILSHQEDLARILTAEQGRPLKEARAEIAYAAAFVEWFSEEGKRSYGEIIPGHARGARLWVERRPVGVVGAITPWNFPAAMITRKVAPALAAGCTMVLKPSELTPFSALALAVLAEEAAIPPGVFNVVTGAPAPIGDVIVEDPRIAKFTFTGSTPVGKALAARCMAGVKRLSLELGGNAPFIVFDDADIERAVTGAMASKFRNAGQTCVCANRFLVQAGVYERFVTALAERAGRLKLGDGLAPDSDIGPLINERAVERVSRHVNDAIEKGATLIVGGKVDAAGAQFFQPTVLRNVATEALLCREETFGPVAGVVSFEYEKDALKLANATPHGLAAYVFTSNFERAHRVSSALEVGMVGLNTGLVSTEVAPFGGCKESGFGREGSKYGLMEFEDLRLVCAELAQA